MPNTTLTRSPAMYDLLLLSFLADGGYLSPPVGVIRTPYITVSDRGRPQHPALVGLGGWDASPEDDPSWNERLDWHLRVSTETYAKFLGDGWVEQGPRGLTYDVPNYWISHEGRAVLNRWYPLEGGREAVAQLQHLNAGVTGRRPVIAPFMWDVRSLPAGAWLDAAFVRALGVLARTHPERSHTLRHGMDALAWSMDPRRATNAWDTLTTPTTISWTGAHPAAEATLLSSATLRTWRTPAGIPLRVEAAGMTADGACHRAAASTPALAMIRCLTSATFWGDHRESMWWCEQISSGHATGRPHRQPTAPRALAAQEH